jgi:uncharacterized protein
MRHPGRATPRRCAAARWIALAIVLLAAPILAAGPEFPRITGRVVDDAKILSPAAVNQLTAMLAKHEQASGEQIVVVTLPSLQGYSIEDFGYQLGRYWGIGQKDKNTGALLIVAPKEHKVRIEIGYGLEGKLTDALCSVIIQRDILPDFRRGDFDAGVLAGTRSLLIASGDAAAAGAAPPAQGQSSTGDEGGMDWIVVIFLLCWLGLFIYERRQRAHGVIRRVGRSGPIIFGGGFPGGHDRGSSSGGDFGGFSGGGGSFGGGGASGSW